METNPESYRISFFKPTTPIAKYNRNLVVWLVCIWAVAIFGFQILLKIVEKPTPEPAYVEYEAVWNQVTTQKPSSPELQQFAGVCVSVLGKNFIQAEEKSSLDHAVSWTLFQLMNENERADMAKGIASFEQLKSEISDITNPAYVEAKDKLNSLASAKLGLQPLDVRTTLIANELTTEQWGVFPTEDIEAIPDIMSKYLIHNQSFLTDFKILGFPFHYFYTAFFLLILFVGLCWLYCIRIDRRNIVLGIPE